MRHLHCYARIMRSVVLRIKRTPQGGSSGVSLKLEIVQLCSLLLLSYSVFERQREHANWLKLTRIPTAVRSRWPPEKRWKFGYPRIARPATSGPWRRAATRACSQTTSSRQAKHQANLESIAGGFEPSGPARLPSNCLTVDPGSRRNRPLGRSSSISKFHEEAGGVVFTPPLHNSGKELLLVQLTRRIVQKSSERFASSK